MSTAKAPSGRICQKYGKATRQTASRQWKNVILLKEQRKNMRHNGTTIFHYVHCTTINGFSIVKVAVFLMPIGTLRKIMAFLRKITFCSSLLPPIENKLRLKSF